MLYIIWHYEQGIIFDFAVTAKTRRKMACDDRTKDVNASRLQECIEHGLKIVATHGDRCVSQVYECRFH